MVAMIKKHHAEGRIARAIEKQTTKVPSDVFLWAAGAAVLGALGLYMAGRERDGIFVGHWVPTLLILGLYNKLVRLLGSD